ncbi:hypothetical protein [Bacteroides sp. UBA939]|uniref:hypothetical protein n=1 Tax=Bacteroides sp. UBA939 TaxID=1946092 RepID=UPI0025C5DB84|nr:hypothetical protein [Bacteroides sp. UBA939]
MLQEHIERFIMLASLEMPNLIVSALFQGAELSDESALLTFLLPKVYSLEELIDELEDQMELILLYHHIPSDATVFGHHCCVYSNPHFDHMYKFNAVSDERCQCDTIYITLYSSLEVMGVELRNELVETGKRGRFVYNRKVDELLRDFI